MAEAVGAFAKSSEPGSVAAVFNNKTGLREVAKAALVIGSYRADLAHIKKKIDPDPGPSK